jgi:hypothetical protein
MSGNKRKNWLIVILWRIIVIVIAYFLVFFICPWIYGAITLECAVMVIVIFIVIVDLLPPVPEGGH